MQVAEESDDAMSIDSSKARPCRSPDCKRSKPHVHNLVSAKQIPFQRLTVLLADWGLYAKRLHFALDVYSDSVPTF